MNVSWWCWGGTGQPWEWRYTPFVGVWLLVGVLAALYVLAHRVEVADRTRSFDRRRTTYLALGLLTLAVASEWPLGQLGAGYSATVAMLRVILYSMVAAPLLLSSLPPWLLRSLIRPVYPLAKAVTRWPVAFLVFNVTVVLVNLPIAVDTLKVTQLGSFALDIALLGASLVLWYPVFGQLQELPRLGDPARAVYVLAQAIIPTGPASFLTFSSFPLFRVYELAPPFFAGFDPLSDQQVAGIMMKVVAGLGLLAYAAVLFFNWERDERDDPLILSVAAGAQQYPIVEGQLTVSSTTVAPGSSVTISGEGFAPNGLVVVTIQSAPVELGRGNADAVGDFTATVRVPADFPPGAHTLSATGPAAGGGTQVLSFEVVVAGSLAVTGLAQPWWLYAGLAAVLLGGGAITLHFVRR